MTGDLCPSKYNYLEGVLRENFSAHYEWFKKSGILKYELVNLVEYCRAVFEDRHFGEGKEEDLLLLYSIRGTINKYLELNSR
jgi:hypothetical protein